MKAIILLFVLAATLVQVEAGPLVYKIDGELLELLFFIPVVIGRWWWWWWWCWRCCCCCQSNTTYSNCYFIYLAIEVRCKIIVWLRAILTPHKDAKEVAPQSQSNEQKLTGSLLLFKTSTMDYRMRWISHRFGRETRFFSSQFAWRLSTTKVPNSRTSPRIT